MSLTNNKNTYFLYEYEFRSYKDIPFLNETDKQKAFKDKLIKLWEERNTYGLIFSSEEESNKKSSQQFFSFDDEGITAGKYFGLVKFGDNLIQILPKIFQDSPKPNNHKEISACANAHILWWLTWCTNIRFPKSLASWGGRKFDFLEILIFLFSNITRDELVFHRHQSYVELEENLGAVRGRIDFGKYAKYYYTGNAQIIPCIYDSLEIDNLYNRIIKFTAKLLLQKSQQDDIKRLLSEIISILDDVQDVHVTASDCSKVVVSPLNTNMQIVLDYCKLFLSGSSITSKDNDFEIFAFMIPMETLYEKFISNFIKVKFENSGIVRSVIFQHNDSTEYLATETLNGVTKNAFRLKPDIYIKRIGNYRDIIIDPKYKMLYYRPEAKENDDFSNGADVHDVRQMMSYAIRYNLNQIYLLYPEKLDTIDEFQESNYEIVDILGSKDEKIVISFKRIPVFVRDFEMFNSDDINLMELFLEKESELYDYLTKIINK